MLFGSRSRPCGLRKSTGGSACGGDGGAAAAEQVDDEGRQGDGAPPGVGLGHLLDDQAAAGHADDGGGDGQGGGVQVERGRADRASLADAHAGAEHEVHEVRQVQADGLGIGGELLSQPLGLGDGQRPRGLHRPGGAPQGDLADRVGGQGAVADGEGEDAGQDAAGGLGRAGAVAAADGGQQPVDGGDGDLAQPQLAQAGQDVGVDDEAVEPLGAGGQLAGLDLGQPQLRGGGQPAVRGRGRRRQSAAVAQGLAQPALGLGASVAVAGDETASAVEVAKAGPGPHPSLADNEEVDLAEGPHRQWWPSHDGFLDPRRWQGSTG
nr:hypothetical protein [Geodermatophilus obscurus]